MGDVNMHHPMWDNRPGLRPNQEEDAFAVWLSDHSMTILNDSRIATHEKGAVIDLVIANPKAISALTVTSEVGGDLAIGSDHDPLLTFVNETPTRQKAVRNIPNINAVNAQKFMSTGLKELKRLDVCQPPTTGKELDAFADSLTNAMIRTLTHSAPAPKHSGKGQRWWNLACKQCAQSHRKARKEWHVGKETADEPVARERMQLTKAKLRKAVRDAKRHFYKQIIETICQPKDVFRAAKWADKKTTYAMPPLEPRVTSSLYIAPMRKLSSY